MKKYADLKRTEREFTIGEWVYLCLQPYRQTSVSQRRGLKLAPRYYGPFQVLERVGSMAYLLKLPPSSKIHTTFHVSQLKKKIGEITPLATIHPVNAAGVLKLEPKEAIARHIVKRNNKACTEVLIRWQGQEPEDVTWEPYARLKEQYSHLEGKVF
ncbi:uncharacterized protein LOC122276751 [Carya illinoinensis]|uniref:uncharacterized protein LOC122276751 n=1 Tax=Carya illinoinensis TaxID=32201 RepID=UPI001C7246BA|nr:uncharacterized protein LOC122276751 [Carya illinoinensis]